jgi:hypothetical protein
MKSSWEATAEAYAVIDPALDAWATSRKISIVRDYQGENTVRTFWLDGKVQIWVEPPNQEGYVKVVASELKKTLPSKWGRRMEWKLPNAEIANGLEEAWIKGRSWL